jgi:hypothetical protein
MRGHIVKGVAGAAALIGVCVLLSAKDVFGFDSPFADDLNIGAFTLTMAAIAQTILVFFVYRQISKEDEREEKRRNHQLATVIADFLAACSTTSVLYAQAAPHAEAFIDDLENVEKQRALQQEITAIEPSRQRAHAEKVRVFVFAGEQTKQNALKLINHIDAQRRKAIGCVSWPNRVLVPGSEPPDPSSMRRALPEDVAESLQREAADALEVS